jgi:hypothetical protein
VSVMSPTAWIWLNNTLMSSIFVCTRRRLQKRRFYQNTLHKSFIIVINLINRTKTTCTLNMVGARTHTCERARACVQTLCE